MKARWYVDSDWTDGSVWDLKSGTDELGYVLRTDGGKYIAVSWKKGSLFKRTGGFTSLNAAGAWLAGESGMEIER